MLCKTRTSRIDARGFLPALVIATLVSLLCPIPIALAQSNVSVGVGLYDPATSFRPDLSEQDLRIIARVLMLSPDEQHAAETLHSGYIAALRTKSDEIRHLIEDAVDHAEALQDQGLLRPAYGQTSDWEASAKKIRKSFLDDLKSLLSRDQESRWPLVERELRRSNLLGNGRLFGESADVLKLLDKITPESFEQPKIADLAEEYAQNLDRALVARTAFLEREATGFHEACRKDPEHARALWNDALRTREAVRNVNEEFLRRIAAELSPEKAEAMKRAFFKQVYARLIVPTRTDRYLTEALALDTLTPDQSQSLEGIGARHESERDRLLHQLAEQERASEERLYPMSLSIALGLTPESARDFNGQQQLPPDSPILPLRQSRYELDRRTRRAVNAVLTEEQRRSIPPDEKSSMAMFTQYLPEGL